MKPAALLKAAGPRLSFIFRRQVRSEAAARNEGEEPGIGPICVPPRINGQEYEMHVAGGISLLEPFEDPLALAETSIHERQPSRRNIPFPRSLFQQSAA
jgi:hypothetical protein